MEGRAIQRVLPGTSLRGSIRAWGGSIELIFTKGVPLFHRQCPVCFHLGRRATFGDGWGWRAGVLSVKMITVPGFCVAT